MAFVIGCPFLADANSNLLFFYSDRREEERVERERCSRRIWDRSGELEDDSRLKRGESKGRGLREKSGTKKNEEETGE